MGNRVDPSPTSTSLSLVPLPSFSFSPLSCSSSRKTGTVPAALSRPRVAGSTCQLLSKGEITADSCFYFPDYTNQNTLEKYRSY